jgi:hypothetical protein
MSTMDTTMDTTIIAVAPAAIAIAAAAAVEVRGLPHRRPLK